MLFHLYYNGFIGNYYIWRFDSEDDNFRQVKNDIPSISTFGELSESFGDLFVDVTDGPLGAHVQSP